MSEGDHKYKEYWDKMNDVIERTYDQLQLVQDLKFGNHLSDRTRGYFDGLSTMYAELIKIQTRCYKEEGKDE